MPPDTLIDAKIEQMKGCYSLMFVDQEPQCANELLERLGVQSTHSRRTLIAGVPMSAHGTFKALYDVPSFALRKIDTMGMSDSLVASAHRARELGGEG